MKAMQKQLREGSIVGDRYEIEKLLTAQDWGSSCLCRDLGAGKVPVRVKFLRQSALESVVPASLSRELSLLRRLRHPNLTRVLDFGILEGSGELFLIDEWVDGESLLAGTEGMDPGDILSLVTELIRALHYLHARGIPHGSLNLSTVILSQRGESKTVRLLDSGLARCLPALSRGGGFETLAYMAPEALMRGDLGVSSDLYSLGILIYQLLARRLPFEDEDPGFLIQKHLQVSVDLRPIARLKRGAVLSQLIRSLLDKDASRRPSCGQALTKLMAEVRGLDGSRGRIRELETHFSASQFVGREKEMQLLQRRAAQIRASGRGWTVFIAGEAGSGKTRLMEELRDWALLDGWRVIEGACGSHEKGSYGPYRQILENTEPLDGESLFQFNDSPRAAESGAFDSSSEFAAGQFRDLLTRELIRRLNRRRTLLLLHDFHQADEATGAVLDYLSSDIQAHPVLMCVSLRSGEESRNTVGRIMDLTIRQERGEALALEPLTKEDVGQLVAGMMGDSELKENLSEWMFGSIGGNPFFLEEMLKHLAEQGLLRRQLDGWRFMDQELVSPACLPEPSHVGDIQGCGGSGRSFAGIEQSSDDPAGDERGRRDSGILPSTDC
ncbi:MAG: putative serine/threonine protein kinase [Acidobacteria bacterium]|nr:putative serine/threonine protein kinase [Acidobacteriota bacterium]